MAYVSYDRAVHATAQPRRRLAWARLLALAAAFALWAVIIAVARALI
ncbi:hypothetical protein [uncultured Caulobacter sp.]|jgi:hypothetical protein|nr:hypothetical protein [uncultured Caulobacter sp.]